MNSVGRNAPCWCGSGSKYKKCHLNRTNEEGYSTKRLLAELKLKISHKECMHPNSGKGLCTKKIIDAHTIQKNGPLKFIANKSSHVFKFGRDRTGKDEISKVGWKNASTFKGFCGKHDKSMFSPIEDVPYKGSKNQSFLAGYRAVALEYFKKISAVKGLPFMSQNLDRGMSYEEQISFQKHLNSLKNGFLKGVDDFKETLDFYKDTYSSDRYDDFKSLSIYFSGKLSVAVSGCFSPEFTVNGQRIQSLFSSEKFVENIAINTLNTENDHCIVFSWPKHFTKCTKFSESLQKVNHVDLPSILVELIFSYIENSYFSEAWLSELNKDERSMIEYMARKPQQYGEAIIFSHYNYTNWKVNRVVRN